MRRKGERIKSVLPVRLYGMDASGKPFNILVRTVDISPNGARLSGIDLVLHVGDIVGLQHGVEKVRCRVVWAGNHEDLQAQIGVTMLQPSKRFWGVHFATAEDTFAGAHKVVPADSVPRPERRQSTRYVCDIGTELLSEGTGTMLWGRCTDLSSGGCYVETRAPIAVGTRIHIRLRTEIAPFQAECVVCSSHPLLGMGLHFVKMSEADARSLGKLLVLGVTGNSTSSAPPPDAPELPAPEIPHLRSLLTTLNSVADSAAKCFCDPAALRAFRQAIVAATALATDVERIHSHNARKSAFAAMPMAVLKYRTQLLAEIGADLGAEQRQVKSEPTDIAQLRGVLRTMEQSLSRLLPLAHDESQRPIPPDIIQFPAKTNTL
jgi:PilZ domain